MKNTKPMCNCPVTIEGAIERAERKGVKRPCGPNCSGPDRTTTKAASKWVSFREGHVKPLMEHAKTCPQGTTERDVLAAFFKRFKEKKRFSSTMWRALKKSVLEHAPEKEKWCYTYMTILEPGGGTWGYREYCKRYSPTPAERWALLKRMEANHTQEELMNKVGHAGKDADPVLKIACSFWATGARLIPWRDAKAIYNITQVHAA